jgi:hypothetical protein
MQCNAPAHCNRMLVTLVKLNETFCRRDATETITKAQFGVQTTIISQQLGVDESAAACDIQNYFKYK